MCKIFDFTNFEKGLFCSIACVWEVLFYLFIWIFVFNMYVYVCIKKMLHNISLSTFFVEYVTLYISVLWVATRMQCLCVYLSRYMHTLTARAFSRLISVEIYLMFTTSSVQILTRVWNRLLIFFCLLKIYTFHHIPTIPLRPTYSLNVYSEFS